MVIAFRWGFIEGAVGSISAVAFLDFFYMPPILSFYENDPQDWISSAIFISIALSVSRFADKLRSQTISAESERTRLQKLYLAGRDIIMMNPQQAAGTQLVALIADLFEADGVAVMDAREARMDKAGSAKIPEGKVRAAYLNDVSESDDTLRAFTRVLIVGTRPIGALYIQGSPRSTYLNSACVDAIATLAAMALERAHFFLAESSAEASRRSEQLRSAMLDGLAHAFKTPLATIHTASSGLLKSARMASTEKELASLIASEANRLGELTSKVLQTAELDEGQLKITLERIEISDFLHDCPSWFGSVLTNHPLRLSERSTVDHLWADLHLLQLALFQLIDNASKYGRPGSPISLRIVSNDPEVVFSVENEGSYIAPEETLHIFERFYRAPATRYRSAGTGIGLFVTKRIAEAHNGRVWVESNQDERTIFFFSLPQIEREMI
jgi:two-component system sensor histidine kinase KdpD